MDNIAIEVINSNSKSNLIQIKLYATTTKVEVVEKYHLDKKSMKKQLEIVRESLNEGESCYIDNTTKRNWLKSLNKKFRKENLNFSIEIMFEDSLGHMTLDVYLEVDDNELSDVHRCYFLVESELGLVYKFIDEFISLLENESNKAELYRGWD